ncbi:hypothetical protein K490DRAFT_73271 [Saccharata proteae CBS 121410]|uniref:Exonuclease domain-containing protein n=1 Tax=Saccharata proteae CBS 121410 TaxID=1314787 RepID=A0A9P4HUK8_9PEZI|nr:hypothetical protein K490DRAFT_73271 [Saccharata proteae CBS 121410]
MSGKKRSHEDFVEDAVTAGDESDDGDKNGAQSQEPRPAANGSTSADGGDWELVERRAAKRQKKVPKKSSQNYPAITHSPSNRLQTHVNLVALQQLVLYILADGAAPQWCAVKDKARIRKVVVLMVPGLEAGMFDGSIPLEEAGAGDGDVAMKGTEKKKMKALSPDDYYPVKLVEEKLPEPVKPFADLFEHLWPVKTPGDDKFAKIHSPLHAMLTAPLPRSKDEKKTKGPNTPNAAKTWQNKRTPITEYLATAEDLTENDYILHPVYYETEAEKEEALAMREEGSQGTAHGWFDTPVEKLEDGAVPESEIEAGSITAGRNIITMDCEMCKTAGDNFELTRISMLDWDGNIILDELVKPPNPITNYLTAYSGITPEMLAPVTTTLVDIQKRLLDIITPRTILVGHSLNSDLAALKLTHPFIIDTSILYPHPRGPPLKSSLKWLSQKYLAREIQKNHGSSGHDSVEDARACLDLVKQKCEKGPRWGTNDMSGESIFKRLSRATKPKGHTASAAAVPRTGAVVDWGDPKKGHGNYATVTVGCETDAEVVEGVKKVVRGRSDDVKVPVEGVDFCWARFRELEAVRGWWTRSKTRDNAEMRAKALAKTQLLDPEAEPDVPANEDSAAVAAPLAPPSDPSPSILARTLSQTVAHISALASSLPPCTALIVYSGTGDPREQERLHALKREFQREYKVKKWDELAVKWTDTEEQDLKRACREARRGVGFVAVV